MYERPPHPAAKSETATATMADRALPFAALQPNDALVANNTLVFVAGVAELLRSHLERGQLVA